MCKLCLSDYTASLAVSFAPSYTINFPISAAKLLLQPRFSLAHQISAPELSQASFSQSEYLLCTYYVVHSFTSSWNCSDQQSSRHSPCPDAYTWLLSVNLAYECSQKYLDLSLISCKFNFMYQQLDVGNSLSDKRAFLLPLKSSPLCLLPSPYCLPSYTPRHILNTYIETSQLQCFLICSGRKIELSVNFTVLLIQWRNQ